MLYSLRMVTDKEITVYLMNRNLSSEEIVLFSDYLRNICTINLVPIDVPKDFFEGFTIGNAHFTVEMYYRIIAQFVLPENLDRILWLDADIVFKKNIDDFYNQDIETVSMVACADSKNKSEHIQHIKRKIGLPEENVYFNSGVLLLNLNYLRTNTTMESLYLRCKELSGLVTYPDQDILNVLYKDTVRIADWKKYNYQICGGSTAVMSDVRNARVVHYTSQKKPWDYKCINRFSRYYWQIKIRQGCFTECLRTYFKAYKYQAKKRLYSKR